MNYYHSAAAAAVVLGLASQPGLPDLPAPCDVCTNGDMIGVYEMHVQLKNTSIHSTAIQVLCINIICKAIEYIYIEPSRKYIQDYEIYLQFIA